MKEVIMDGLLVVLDFLLAFLSPAVSYSKPQVMLLCILVEKRESRGESGKKGGERKRKEASQITERQISVIWTLNTLTF